MVMSAENFAIGTEIEAWHVEEREIVPDADVEEEVRRSLVVPVLEHERQGELEQVLIEADRLLDIAAEQRDVMNASSCCRRTSLT